MAASEGGDVILFGGRVVIPAHLFDEKFSRSGGPGGQNVNKVASRAELRLPLAALGGVLSDDELARVRSRLRSRITNEGDLRIVSDRFRDQPRNREDCRARLRELLEEALRVPKKRVATKASRSSKRRRLDDKRRQSEKKRLRRSEPE